jgi:RES domain-containing protein
VVDALYLAGDEDGMWAEWYRHLAESGVPPMRALPRDVWRFAVGATRVADLSTAARLDAVGLTIPPPGRRSWPACQDVGERLHAEGWAGLIAPSAARPEHSQVLCLFIAPGDGFPSHVVPQPPPRVVIAPPAVPTGLRT